MKHLTLRIAGRVQGVFFRQSTAAKAQELGLSGWVRNEASGDVMIEVEGSEHTLAPFVAWCHHGPPHAQVTHVEVSEGPLTGMTGFHVASPAY